MVDDKDEPFQNAMGAETSTDTDSALTPIEAGADASGPDIKQPAAAAAHAEKRSRPSRGLGLSVALIAGLIGGFGGAFALRYFDTLAGPDPVDGVAEASARADALERKSAATDSALAALKARLGAVESGAGEQAASMQAALRDLRQSAAGREAPNGDGSQAEAPDLAPLQQKIDAIEEKVGAMESAMAPKADSDAEAAKALSAVQSAGVVAANLMQRVGRGEPFASEVAALANLGVDPAKLAPLRVNAATGVASISDLADQFAALAPSLEAPDAPAADAGVLERLAHDASNLVHIHRAGDPHETDVPGRIAAIEGALAKLDVAKAYAAWLQLPDAAKAKSAGWGAAAKARLDATAAANAIEAEAVAALSKTKS